MLVKFNNQEVYMSVFSFQQNHKIAKELRFDVSNEINDNYLVSIGGESYLFGLTNDKIKNVIHYTNSKYIFNDAILNNNYFNKQLQNYLIDYNIFSTYKNGKTLIINLAKLNIKLLTEINKRFYKKIIIINCHHNEFWKRIPLLSNYKLIKRKQYILDYHFITVNILVYKKTIPTFISIGNNCACAYQLHNLNLRYNSFPFDWAKMNIKKLNKVLSNKFKNFSNLNIFKFSENHLYKFINNYGTYILKNDYNIQFAHEYLNQYELHILKNKFDIRISKFKMIKNQFSIFVLLNLEKNIDNEMDKLINNLQYYSNNFKILYISNYQIKKNNYVIPYYIDNQWSDWQFDHLDWYDIIFNTLNMHY